MTMAMRIHRPGGPEVLTWDEVEVGRPGPGEALIRHSAVGLNYIDTYYRSGMYPITLPAILGAEAAGVVAAVGEDVTIVKPGDRVAYTGIKGSYLGAYAETRLFPAERLIRLPDGISEKQAAAMMLKGMTAEYLVRRTYPVKAGDVILVHAAAGGVGLILCQWAKHLGATVIGTVGSAEKAGLAKAHGCDHPIVYTRESFVERVKELTGGDGVKAVYDSVGKDTFEGSLACLQPHGLIAGYGQSSGNVPPFDMGILRAKGLFVTKPGLHTHTATRAQLEDLAKGLFEVVSKGIVKIEIRQTYALKDVANAHRDLEARKTTGSTVLLP